jgi:hypothetical protein
MLRFFRRRKDSRLRELGEAEAYERVHGDRGEVKRVHLPPRRKRYDLPVSGETLRRGFEERIRAREEEQEAKRPPDD